MGLDLTTVAAQIINFLVLIALLNRFLYRPVTRVMKEREERVRRRTEQAEALEAKAKAELAAYEARRAELEQERARLLEEAREEASQERSRLLREAAEEARQARERFAEALAAERAELEAEIQEGLIRRICETSGYVVSQLGGLALEDAILATLERRWEEERERAPEDGPAPAPAGSASLLDRTVEIRTSFAPTEEQRARLTALARRMVAHMARVRGAEPLPFEPAVEFRRDPDLLLGIEIQWGGASVSWSARDVLQDVQRDALTRLVPDGQRASGAAQAYGAAWDGAPEPR